MRDHRSLKAFQLADALVLRIYRVTSDYPQREVYGLSAQLRRGVVSVASNIVEGCARETAAEYARFMTIAYSAAQELHYQLTVADRLGYHGSPDRAVGQASDGPKVLDEAAETARVLAGIVRSLSGPNT